jgi:hypothetical protein
MQLCDGTHLTYCTNIYAGEDWPDLSAGLKAFLPKLKAQASPRNPMGVGLRLGARAAGQLLEGNRLRAFAQWLDREGLYVFTLNGFPYGDFHDTSVKAQVHQPDWSQTNRLEYTLQLARILAELLPAGMEGGISTSPLSYRYWHAPADRPGFMQAAARNLLQAAVFLREFESRTGCYIHLDIEPEPDGLLETTRDVLGFFQDILVPEAATHFHPLPPDQARSLIFRYLCLCYDVCHMAVEFEFQMASLEEIRRAGLRIGKFQLSAALEAGPKQDATALLAWDEPTYLHQVVGRDADGVLHRFRDLPEADSAFRQKKETTWRSHFHVPIFREELGDLRATQADLREVLAAQREHRFSKQLEVETYTWDVLPKAFKTDLLTSVSRELEWVKQLYEKDRST